MKVLEQDTINICLATDNNYTKYAGVVMTSILANAYSDEHIVFYILDGGITPSAKEELLTLKKIKDCDINFIQIRNEDFQDYQKVKTHKYVTLATYYRLKLTALLPQVDKIIYFDCDFIINSSLKELFNTNLEGKPIAGVLDIKKKMTAINPTYVNAGMLIFDLKRMRELNIEERFLNWALEHYNKITCGDQEIINEVCRDNIKLLDNAWNVQSSNFTNRSTYIKNPKGIHFISARKPWHYASYSYHKKYYFKYLEFTPWALKGWKKFLWGPINEIVSCIKYIGYRPLFLLRPMFYKALYHTYIKPLLGGEAK